MTGAAMLLGVATPRAMAQEEAEASVPPSFVLAERLAAYLQSVQHPTTGLPLSFAQSADPVLTGVTFTYDVAVAALVLAHAGEFESARRALQTYIQMPLPSPDTFDFNTAYDIATRTPTLEFRVHGGPLFWVAIALLRYGEAAADNTALNKGVALLEWARTNLPHHEGGVAMSHRDFWHTVMSVENNWVYYAALRIATQLLPEGPRRRALLAEQQAVHRWLQSHQTDRGPGDSIKALDVYTHALLVGPAVPGEDDAFRSDADMAQWAQTHIAQLDELFELPGTALYDYTDAQECKRIGRPRAAWLEGTEQVSLAYQTWASWFEQHGDTAYVKELRAKTALSHAEALRYAIRISPTLVALPNTSATVPFRTFHDGWDARPRSEPALNGTNWAYLVEVQYNPFTTALPRKK